MGLQELAQKGATLGIKLSGNIARPVLYFPQGEVTFNALTGQNQVAHFRQYNLSGVFTNYREEEVNGTSIMPEDKKFLLPSAGLTFEPNMNDEFHEGVGPSKKVWKVIARKADPAKALWILQVRR